nr:immunoglobulin heavy chain junction region [Macaca mulatta]MOW45504.1 immunoglobulin heavy chain junction region [Macaca mulatta]MOW45618.1 immunoglobulin heavy chain junction region [Macaca mulatta]MOW46081.1 immunoglobulin heavy chain junction region [Macaca mulatta]MOW46452.1 immunoglobulin heavy chain junction region [Macaca mulatta]
CVRDHVGSGLDAW